jgi:hypothetical protein
MLPDTVVWLKSISFQVDPKANNGAPFVCHVVIPYSKDLKDRLMSMDSKAYFNNIDRLEKEYRDSIEVFKFDLIPGKNQLEKRIDVRSYAKAMGAYLFAKYSTAGKFMESVGASPIVVVKCQQYKIEVLSVSNLQEVFSADAK